MMSPDNIVLLGKVIVAIGTILSIIGVPLYKYLIYPFIIQKLINFKENIKQHYKQWCDLANTAEMVHDIIKKELQTNGGSSIKDSIKRIEGHISIIDAKYKAFVSLENEPVWESDENGGCIWANSSYLKMTGFDFDYLKNAGWISIINENDRSRVREEWNMAIKEKRVFSCEFIINRFDGTKIKVFGKSFPILSSIDESITGYVGRLSFCNSHEN